MVDFLSVHFKCSPERTLIAIGPSIGPCCYEISRDMADRAESRLPPFERCIVTAPDGRLTFDLWQANRNQLIAAGIQERHIVSADTCTACHTDLFYSYRKEERVTGRFGALIGLKKA
jgi:copper oxidase (laccase) domain-containing protein